MNTLTADFQDVFSLYLRLGEELTRVLDVEDSKDPQALVESVLENQDCLARIEQMNARILQLSESWGKCRDQLDPDSQIKIRDLAQASRAQALRLKDLCAKHAQKIQATRDQWGRKLDELARGARYLQSVKPVKNNYPKFVDSVY